MDYLETKVNESETFPDFFQALASRCYVSPEDLRSTSDGFFAITRSLAEILAGQGITTFPNEENQQRQCDKFFDDWYLYAVPNKSGHIYSLFKLREQESDASGTIPADGDIPGVTVSFISFKVEYLETCLTDPSPENRKALNREINRVVAARGQTHHNALKAYFGSSKAEGPYLIAELYVRHIASFAQNGVLPVPQGYAALCRDPKNARLPRFIAANNEAAGYLVCDGENLHFQDPSHLNSFEKRAILATHTANTSFHSFAAEVQYHARFLTWYAKVPLPILGRSVYSSAIRADLTIGDTEFQGPAPFYRPDSRWVRQQKNYHPDF